MDNAILKAALKYINQGLSVFPCNPFPSKDGFQNKQPYLSFVPYRDRTPTEDEIREWWIKWPSAMIGCITGKTPNNLTIIDADSERAYKELQKYFPESYQTKIAKSPKGYHLYFKFFEGPPNSSRIMESAIKDVDCRTEGGYIIMPPSINLKNGNATPYKWLINAPVEEVPSSLRELIINSLYIGKLPDSKNGSILVNGSKEMFEFGRRDDALFHVSNCLTKGGMPASETYQVLEKLIISWGEKPDRKWIEAKIGSALKRDSKRFESMAEGVRDFVSVNSGKFSVKDVEIWVNSSKLQSNKPILMELGKLVKDEKIERLQHHGHYRIIETDFDAVCFDDIDIGESLRVRLPFGLERYVEIMPKDLIVFAGVPNAGKSAIMMETAGLNQSLADCWYFSSEMGRVNWKKRLSKYEGNAKWKYKFVDDFPNFVDVIKPDAFNFIDYVEIADGEFYKIPSVLAAIQKRLKSGLAFVALQKNPEKTHGVGGYQTLAKPALFCTIDPDFPGAIMRVVKAKNYIDVNPNGFFLKFKIINGINLRAVGTWMPE